MFFLVPKKTCNLSPAPAGLFFFADAGKLRAMKYKGYTATIEYDEEEEAFHGRVNNITDLVIFYGRSVGELKRGMASSIEDYLALCAKKGIEPQRPTD